MRQVSVFFLCLIFAVCQSQEKKDPNENKCKVVLMPSEVLQWQYIGFMKDSSFYKSQFANFAKVKTGILLYKWHEGSGSSNFFIVNFDEGFNALVKTEKQTRQVDFSVGDKKKLKFISGILEKESYYQNCVKDHGHSVLYVLVVRYDNEMRVQYYSPATNPYEIETSDTNLNSIKEIFRIIERNYYKDITVKKIKGKRKSSES